MNKVYDYMMAAKPILYGVEAKNNDVLEAKCGLFFDATNIDELVDKLYQLKNMSNQDKETMGKKLVYHYLAPLNVNVKINNRYRFTDEWCR